MASFDWVPFYEAFASRLLAFKDRRPVLVELIKQAYANIGMKLPILDRGELRDIDPFTVFGLFNKGITDANRSRVAQGLGKTLGVAAKVPTSFEGIPVLDNRNATFYYFSGDSRRPAHDIDTLWDLFASALSFADNGGASNKAAFVVAFDRARLLPTTKWKLSMGLYWARPQAFLSLDKCNHQGLGEQAMLGPECAAAVQPLKSLPDAQTYLKICDLCHAALAQPDSPYHDIPNFSYVAWLESERINNELRAARKAAAGTGTDTMGDAGVRGTHYWIYSPGTNAERWPEFQRDGIMAIGWGEIGDLGAYGSRADVGNALRDHYDETGSYQHVSLELWQFAHDMEPGDVVYAKRGTSLIVGRGVVRSAYRFDEDRADEFQHLRSVEWTDSGAWPYPAGKATVKTLTDLTSQTGKIEKIKALFERADDEGDEPDEPRGPLPTYGRREFLDEVYLDPPAYDRLTALVRHKRNVILEGAPGVGKTFMAKRLAYSLMGEKDPSRVELVQFHQSYSYEDFVMGYRPVKEGFELAEGTFYQFCKRAESDPDRDYFFIIDEINRGNLSKIFGELFMLIEPDKRGAAVRLLYADERFSVPANIYLIGTMNTADRSLALIDYALRRRFAFFELDPGFDTAGFRSYQEGLGSPAFDRLIACMRELNDEIAADDSLGRGFRIGHSFFCNLTEADPTRLREIVDYELAPLLAEYWFDDIGRSRDWTQRLRSALGDR